MKIGRLFGITLRIDPLLIAVLAPAFLLGIGKTVCIAFAVVLMHEFCHVLIGRLLGVQTQSVELMPFGGVARMQAISGGKEMLIAAAGPASNLALAALLDTVALRWPGLAGPFLPWVQVNVMIGVFNLIPAYPLDGGRVLRAMLTLFVGLQAATRMVCWLGMGMGVCVIFGGVSPMLREMPMNVSLIVVGAFVVHCAWRELQGMPSTAYRNATGKKRRMRSRPLEQKNIAASGQSSARDLLQSFAAGKYHIITVLDDDMDAVGTLGEADVVRVLMDWQDATLYDILRLKKEGGCGMMI